LPKSSYPNAWIVLGGEDLKSDERAKLEAIAPVFADPYSADMKVRRSWANTLPIHFEGDGISGFSFVDQNDEVILLVSNTLDSPATGQWVLSGVATGSFTLVPLRAGDPIALELKDGAGKAAISLGANETRVYSIKGLVEPSGATNGTPSSNNPAATGDTKSDTGCSCRIVRPGSGSSPDMARWLVLLGLGFGLVRRKYVQVNRTEGE